MSCTAPIRFARCLPSLAGLGGWSVWSCRGLPGCTPTSLLRASSAVSPNRRWPTRCSGGPTVVLPDSLRDLLLATVGRLPEETQEALRAASAAGPHVGHPLLAAVTGLDDDPLARALRPAVAANVLTAGADGYAFRHALIREAIYDDLLPGERTRLHTRFAEALGSDPGLVGPGRAATEQAYHWYHAHDPACALTSAWH